MKKIIETVKSLVETRNQCFVDSETRHDFFDSNERECFQRKKKGIFERSAEIVKSSVNGQITSIQQFGSQVVVSYVLHFQHFVKQKKKFYLEEYIQNRKATFQDGELTEDKEINVVNSNEEPESLERNIEEVSIERFSYNRAEAVKYAERWWNDFNPQFKKFNDNCTNFVSQCLYAGGAPMTGHPNRSKGWWYRGNNWSFSWSVAHSLRWYLSGAKTGLRGKEMPSAKDLSPGDVICYDFNGNGRWQHTTIVVAKDGNGEPLVNAQTTNSRMRYWKYEDSTAWTPNIKYKFFHIH